MKNARKAVLLFVAFTLGACTGAPLVNGPVITGPGTSGPLITGPGISAPSTAASSTAGSGTAGSSTEPASWFTAPADGQEENAEASDAKQAANLKASTMLRVAKTATANGDAAGSVTLLKRVVTDHPDMPKAKTALAMALLEKGDATAALAYFNEAAAADPADLDNIIGAGQAMLALHQHAKARKKFIAALAKEPGNIQALNGLGVSLDAMEHHRLAQQSYQKALAIEPQNGSLRSNYGLSLALSGLYVEAVAELLPLTKDEGEVGKKARQNLALAYAMQGDFENASRWSLVDQKPEDIRNDLKIYGSVRPN